MKKVYLFIAIIFLVSVDANSQRGRNSRRNRSSYVLQNEIGINAGISNFQGDFTADGPFDGLITVNGFTVNATHSLHIAKTRRARRRIKKKNILNYLMLKSNLGYTKGSYNNYGISTGNEDFSNAGSVATDNGSIHNNIILGRITSETSIISLGTQLEFYFRDLQNFLHSRGRMSKSRRRYRRKRGKIKKGNMYVAAGFGFNYVNSEYDSGLNANELTILENSNGTTLPDNWTEDVPEDLSSVVFSATAGFGYRYKLTETLDLNAEFKYNYYTSDLIDAVNPDESPNISDSQDKANDYNTNITLGVIYHLF